MNLFSVKEMRISLSSCVFDLLGSLWATYSLGKIVPKNIVYQMFVHDFRLI